MIPFHESCHENFHLEFPLITPIGAYFLQRFGCIYAVQTFKDDGTYPSVWSSKDMTTAPRRILTRSPCAKMSVAKHVRRGSNALQVNVKSYMFKARDAYPKLLRSYIQYRSFQNSIVTWRSHAYSNQARVIGPNLLINRHSSAISKVWLLHHVYMLLI